MSRSIPEILSARWALATQMFKETIEPPTQAARADLIIPKSVVGWLIPLDTEKDVPTLDKFSIDRHQKAIQIGSDHYKIEMFPGILMIHTPEGKKIEAFHGEKVTLGDKSFKLSLLAARAFFKWFAAGILFFSHLISTAQTSTPNAETPEPSAPASGENALPKTVADLLPKEDPTKPKAPAVIVYNSQTSDQNGIAQAPYRAYFDASLLIPGLSESQEKDISSTVLAEGKYHKIPITEAQQRKSFYFIQVDVSSHCLTRKKEELINTELKRFISKIPKHSYITLTTFYGVNGRPVYDLIFKFKKSDELEDRVGLISCQPHSESINALEAMAFLKPYLKEMDSLHQTEKQSDWWRRVFVTFTSGNIGITSEAESILKNFDLDFYPIVYSSVQSPVTRTLLTRLTQMNEGEIFWWNEAGPLNFSERFPFLWTFHIFASLPFELEEKSYPLEVTYKTPKAVYKVTSEVSYLKDKRALFFYQMKILLLVGFGVLFLIYFLYRVYDFYRVKICTQTKLPMSHTWNDSIFKARGRYPVLLMTSFRGYERAFVLQNKITLIGENFKADLRLTTVHKPTVKGYVIKKNGYETYEISSSDKTPFGINGVRRKNPLNLRHGDVFEFGEYRVQFLFPVETEDLRVKK
jgi:hypothetical protein